MWENCIAHLFEHGLPGLALALREVAALRYRPGEEGTDAFLAALGELYQLTQAFLHREELPAAERLVVRLRAGVQHLAREQVLAMQPAVFDTWHVLSQRTEEERKYGAWHHRHTWLSGQATGRYALVLESLWQPPPPPTLVLPTGQYQGTLHFYPGACPLRAIPGEAWRWQEPEAERIPPGCSPWQLAYHPPRYSTPETDTRSCAR